ncbi:MAG: nuclear transport factor 2 family protein [Gemmatimonadetes bacterium]|nr:nuclear transport factor 2 family protein [Gemmatimonadota bacterium]
MPRLFLAVALLLALTAEARAQDPVVGAPDADALFHSSDPKLDRNKQAAYHIEKDLLEAGHWEMADQWLTERYIQHNPNAASGRAGVVNYFTKVLKVAPKPIAPKLARPVVAVIAEGDYVVVITPRELQDPKDPSRKYTTSWFDMWRFSDGKADEHWDGATK